jgi:hypothetical protein
MKPSVLLVVLGVLCCLLVQTNEIQAFDGAPATLKIGETEVARNGIGTRSKMMLSLYECALYLPEKSNDSEAILASDQPMAVRIEVTSRFVSQAKMLSALKDGFQASTGGDTSAIEAEIKKFGDCFSAPINMGDVFVLAYTPSTGMVVYKNNQRQGAIGGLEFKKAVMGIWLGKKPIDAHLKTAMLGSAQLR